MNFDEAAKYIANKNLKHDLDIVEKASKKWVNKKQAKLTLISDIPSSVKTDQDLLQMLKDYRKLLDLQKELVQNVLPKHFADTYQCFEHLLAKNDGSKIDAEAKKACQGTDTFAKHLEQVTHSFEFIPYLTSHKELGEYKSGANHEFPITLRLGTSYIYDFPGEHHTESKTAIIFDKSHIGELIKEIMQYVGMPLKDAVEGPHEVMFNSLKQFYQKMNRLAKESTDTERDADIAKLLIHFTGDESDPSDFHETIYSDIYNQFIMPLESNWMSFIVVIRNVIEVIEKTDGWLSSKNI